MPAFRTRIWVAIAILAISTSTAGAASMEAKRLLLGGGGSILGTFPVDMDFAHGRYVGCTPGACLSTVRASNSTDLLPSSPSGYVYNTYTSNVPTISPGFGLCPFESRTNVLLNSTAPVTQTTGSLGTGSYTLWVNGSGSALASGGTATITGAASATNGSPNVFTVTVAGTVTVTVTGSLNEFQLEAGGFGTSFIVTAGASATRAGENISAAGSLIAALNTPPFTIVVSLGGSPSATPRVIDDSTDTQTQLFVTTNAVRSAPSSGQIIATIGGGLNIPNPFRVALGYDVSGGSLVANNGTLATGVNAWTSANVPPRIGSTNGTSNFYNGCILRISAKPVKLPNTTLQVLSQ